MEEENAVEKYYNTNMQITVLNFFFRFFSKQQLWLLNGHCIHYPKTKGRKNCCKITGSSAEVLLHMTCPKIL